jgi:hypothetical protein
MNGVISGKRGVNRSGTMGPSQKSAFNPLPRAIAIDKKWKKVDVGSRETIQERTLCNCNLGGVLIRRNG